MLCAIPGSTPAQTQGFRGGPVRVLETLSRVPSRGTVSPRISRAPVRFSKPKPHPFAEEVEGPRQKNPCFTAPPDEAPPKKTRVFTDGGFPNPPFLEVSKGSPWTEARPLDRGRISSTQHRTSGRPEPVPGQAPELASPEPPKPTGKQRIRNGRTGKTRGFRDPGPPPGR